LNTAWTKHRKFITAASRKTEKARVRSSY